MADEITIPAGASKQESYELLLPQIDALISGEPDLIANLSNITAAIQSAFNFLWIGFYFVREHDTKEELVLGPFQGPVACTRIGYGKGVCGSAWKESRTLLVPDVDQFPEHIACSGFSRSEIVVPVIRKNKVVAVLDVDSVRLNHFDDTDAVFLEKICQRVAALL